MLNIDIEFKPSWIFLLSLATLWVGGNIMVFTLDIPFYLKLAIWALMLIYLLRTMVMHGLLQHQMSVTSLQLKGRQWYVNQKPVALLGDSTVTRLFAVLRFQCLSTKKTTVSIVLPDSLHGMPYQQLVMLLRTVDILAHEK